MIKTTNISDNYSWSQVSNPTTTELQTLINHYGATVESLGYALDENERPRTVVNVEKNIFLIIFDAVSSNFNDDGKTEPVAFMFLENSLISFTHANTRYVNRILERNITSIASSNQANYTIEAVIQTLLDLTSRYMDAITQINEQREILQNRFKTKLNQAGIQSLLQLETSIIYLLTSIKANDTAIVGMSKLDNLRLTKKQRKLLDTLVVEVDQSQDMTELSSQIIESVSSSYSNILDSNLNHTMKFLTVFSIILAVPNIVFGFYGQNVPLPFSNAPWSWIMTIGISIILVVLVYIISNQNDFFKK